MKQMNKGVEKVEKVEEITEVKQAEEVEHMIFKNRLEEDLLNIWKCIKFVL